MSRNVSPRAASSGHPSSLDTACTDPLPVPSNPPEAEPASGGERQWHLTCSECPTTYTQVAKGKPRLTCSDECSKARRRRMR